MDDHGSVGRCIGCFCVVTIALCGQRGEVTNMFKRTGGFGGTLFWKRTGQSFSKTRVGNGGDILTGMTMDGRT